MEEITQELEQLPTIGLLYLLDNISAQILEIVIARTESEEQQETH